MYFYRTNLKKGDKLALLSLSSGMAGDTDFKPRYNVGRKRLHALGFDTTSGTYSLNGSRYLFNYPSARASDLQVAFSDPSVKGIVANIGGDDSYRVLPFLDDNELKKHPKPVIGYSDTTTIHFYLYQLGIQTYYGPSVLDGFAENVGMHRLTRDSFLKMTTTEEVQELVSSPKWTSAYLPWENRDNDQIPRPFNNEKHGHIFEKYTLNQVVDGNLLGGCLDSIYEFKKSPYFPDLEHWQDKIIFLETSERKMSPVDFRKALSRFKEELSVARAVLFGKPYDEEYFSEYLEIAKNMLTVPFVFNVNFGHTAPMYTIPYGGLCRIDFGNKRIWIRK